MLRSRAIPFRLQPLVHSARAQVGRGLGWHRAGSQVCYYANSIRRGRASAAHGQVGRGPREAALIWGEEELGRERSA